MGAARTWQWIRSAQLSVRSIVGGRSLRTRRHGGLEQPCQYPGGLVRHADLPAFPDQGGEHRPESWRSALGACLRYVGHERHDELVHRPGRHDASDARPLAAPWGGDHAHQFPHRRSGFMPHDPADHRAGTRRPAGDDRNRLRRVWQRGAPLLDRYGAGVTDAQLFLVDVRAFPPVRVEPGGASNSDVVGRHSGCPHQRDGSQWPRHTVAARPISA